MLNFFIEWTYPEIIYSGTPEHGNAADADGAAHLEQRARHHRRHRRLRECLMIFDAFTAATEVMAWEAIPSDGDIQ